MDDAQKLDLFIRAFKEIENKDLVGVELDTDMATLGLDSVATAEVIGWLEEEFSCQIPDEDIGVVRTVGALMELFVRHVA